MVIAKASASSFGYFELLKCCKGAASEVWDMFLFSNLVKPVDSHCVLICSVKHISLHSLMQRHKYGICIKGFAWPCYLIFSLLLVCNLEM